MVDNKDLINSQTLEQVLHAGLLTLDRKGTGYICPKCSSGTGKHGTGMRYDKARNKYHCFSCDTDYDVIRLITEQYGLDERRGFVEACKKASDLFGIRLEYKNGEEETHEPQPSQRDFILDAHKKLLTSKEGQAYLKKRGISEATAKKFKLGYADGRIVIPTSDYSYVARAISEEDFPKIKASVGERHTFNLQGIARADKPIWITEGEIDALSIIEAGGLAIGIGGIGRVKKVAEELKCREIKVPVLLALDNDAQGKKAQLELQNALADAQFEVISINPYGRKKDANEVLVSNAEELKWLVNCYAENPKAFDTIRTQQTSHGMQAFIEKAEQNAHTPLIDTGFNNINDLLGGGLYPELYTLIADTGVGKSIFCQNIADNIARSGRQVLYYTLEMSAFEMQARSISRIMFDKSKDELKSLSASKIMFDIQNASTEQKYYFSQAIDDYAKNIEPHLQYFEAIGYYDTKIIKDHAELYTRINGEAPVIFIDYLQTLSLGVSKRDKGLTEYEAINTAIVDLKEINRLYGCPIIVISSKNRTSTREGNTDASAKGSGNIEYTTGVLLNLDFTERIYKEGKTRADIDAGIEQAMRESTRPMTIEIRKQRHGSNHTRADFIVNYLFCKYTENHLMHTSCKSNN